MQDLLAYTAEIAKTSRSLTQKPNASDEDVLVWAHMTLCEEVGELSAEIRKRLKLSFNAKKCAAFQEEDMQLESIDVLICTLLLMHQIGLDSADVTDDLIYKKIGRNRERGY